MGSGDWLKNIIGSKKSRSTQIKRSPESGNSNGANHKNNPKKKTSKSRATSGKLRVLTVWTEDIAATRIQTAFRGYMARKSLRRLKGKVRLQVLTQRNTVTKQTSTTLSYLHTWQRIQSEVRARRVSMVTDGRNRQKKLENQLKLEGKLHDLEVEWCGGAETMEEALARIHLREEAAVKRERALAYSFSHQWRANSNSILGYPEIGKADWGWSWIERWIAARPWENRVVIQTSPKKLPNKPGKSTSTTPNGKGSLSIKKASPNGKGTLKVRRLSYPGTEKPAPRGSIKKEIKIENGRRNS